MRSALVTAVLALALAGGAAAAPAPLVRDGLHLYGQYCAGCHGPDGRGIPKPLPAGYGPTRDQKPQRGAGPSLRGVGALAADFYLTTGYMPLPQLDVEPHRREHLLLTQAQIRALTAYVASLGNGPAVATPHPERGNVSIGMRAFTHHCAGCHQVAAQGGYVGNAVAPPLAAATPRQIAEAVRVGPYVMPRFSTRQISPHELDSIVAYVRYTAHPDDRGGWSIGRIGPVPEGLVTWLLAATVLLAVCVLLGRRLRES